MMKKKTILYFFPQSSTFIDRDLKLLSKQYFVKAFNLKQGNKILLIPMLIRQLFFILRFVKSADIYICHFAGYSAFIPAILGKVFSKPCLIIVAGTDAAKFPRFKYGNFTRKLLGYITAKSLKLAKHILPVHESLVYQLYNYDEAGAPAQGYTVFASELIKVPFTPIYYGYDSEEFKPIKDIVRKESTFITVGNLSSNNLFIRKGYDLILDLANKRPELSFTLVGWDGKSILDRPPNVILLPYMNQQELIKVLSSHEFFFQLSFMEGFPNALCEAMLCSCIPIGSNVSGIPTIIGNSGFILHKRDLNTLNKVVTEALSFPNRSSLSVAARKRIKENFTYNRRRQELVQVIENYTNKTS
jgi:glycosyltransferase involved in cell wall biosynthesis